MQTQTPPPVPPGAPPAAPIPARLRAAAGALALLLGAGCVDRTATGPELLPPPDAPGRTAVLACRANVRTGTVECASPAPGPGGGSAVILGGQGLNVRLRSSNPSYDGADTFRVDVTVENLTGQALGTTDGATPAPDGVRVFFASGPVSATGEVAVANATGQAAFMAAAQKYFQYDGLLAPGDTTAPLEWRFSMPPTVESFEFGVYVAAAVPHEEGWLRLAPFLPSVAVGESMPLSAQRMDVAGRPRVNGPVTWSSADSTIARVAADGTVTGMAAGTTKVVATDGTRTSSVEVHVFAGGGDVVPPTAHGLTLVPARVSANGADSVTVSLRLTDGGTGTRFMQVSLSSPSSAHTASCSSWEPATGTRADGTFTCRAPIVPHAEGGAWRVSQLWFEDVAGNRRTAGVGQVREAGMPSRVYVHSPAADLQAPTVTGVAFTPDSVEANGVDSVTMTLQVEDAGSGVAHVQVWFRNPAGNTFEGCETGSPFTGTTAAGTFRCRLAIPSGAEPGNWLLDAVATKDVTGNAQILSTAALDSAGFATTLQVTGPPADTQPPTLTDFSFSPDSVAANGADSVTIRMELTDAGSGGYRAEATFISASNQTAGCLGFSPVAPHPGSQEITCRVAIASGRETGEWRIQFLWLEDADGNATTLQGAELASMGYPITLTVTP